MRIFFKRISTLLAFSITFFSEFLFRLYAINAILESKAHKKIPLTGCKIRLEHMNILILTNEYPPYSYGGAGVHVEYLSQELAKYVSVEVRSFGDQDETRSNLRIKGFPVNWPQKDSPKALRPVFEAAQRAVDMNRIGIQADLVHCHTWYTHLGGIIAKLNYGIPLVVTTHSLEPLRPWKREQLGKGYDFALWVERTALEMADAVIAVSEGTKQDILRNFSVAPSNIHVIHNGIDLREFSKTTTTHSFSAYGIDPTQPYILFVGRITRQKGIIHLVQAIRHLHPSFQIVLAAGSPDTQEIADEMRTAVQEASSQRPGVVWIQEMVPKAHLIELYSHASVFCCPSIYEPFGIINLEAMACEVPVVASQVGGIPEVVQDGETGTLVALQQLGTAPFAPKRPEQFSQDLAQAINHLMDNPDLRMRMGKAARKRAEELFSWSAIALRTKSLYEQLMSLPGNS